MRRLALLVLLTVCSWALPPEEVVRQVYSTHKHSTNQRRTVSANPKCFTPGFLGILERAYAGQPPKPFVDFDVFSNTQVMTVDYEVGKPVITGKDARVPITVWVAMRPIEREKALARKAVVHLTDVGDGDGFQIKDIEFLPTKDLPRGMRVRELLTRIAEGQR